MYCEWNLFLADKATNQGFNRALCIVNQFQQLDVCLSKFGFNRALCIVNLCNNVYLIYMVYVLIEHYVLWI